MLEASGAPHTPYAVALFKRLSLMHQPVNAPKRVARRGAAALANIDGPVRGAPSPGSAPRGNSSTRTGVLNKGNSNHHRSELCVFEERPSPKPNGVMDD